MAECECSSAGSAPIEYRWEKLNGPLGVDIAINQGYIRFSSLRKSDEGDYRCIARNPVGEDSQILHVYVRERHRPQPQPIYLVEINPPNYRGKPGEEVRLSCNSQPEGELVWSKSGHQSLPQYIYVNRGILVISHARVEDSGRYICSSAASHVAPVSSTIEVVIDDRSSDGDRPSIQRFNEIYNVIQGHDLTLNCPASGNPTPTVKWERVHEPFNANTQQSGNSLRIINLQPENRGVYTCSAENLHGTAQETAIIDVERKFSNFPIYLTFKIKLFF